MSVLPLRKVTEVHTPESFLTFEQSTGQSSTQYHTSCMWTNCPHDDVGWRDYVYEGAPLLNEQSSVNRQHTYIYSSVPERLDRSHWIPRPRPKETHKPTPFYYRKLFPIEVPPMYSVTAERYVTYESEYHDYPQQYPPSDPESINNVFPWWWTYQNASTFLQIGTVSIATPLLIGGFNQISRRTKVENRQINDSTRSENYDRISVCVPGTPPYSDSYDSGLVDITEQYPPDILALLVAQVGGKRPIVRQPLDDLVWYIDGLAHSNCVANLSQGKVNVGIFLGELNQTLGFLGTLLMRLYRCISSIYRADFASALKALRWQPSRRQRRKNEKLANLDDFVLEYSFALRPLLSDIYGFIDTYLAGLIKNGQMVHARSYAETSSLISQHTRWSVDKASVSPSFHHPGETAAAVGYTVAFKVINSQTRSLQELGLINPIEVVWEKIPGSFLIDWIVNLNSILPSLTATAGLEFVHGCKTTYRLYDGTFSEADWASLDSVMEASTGVNMPDDVFVNRPYAVCGAVEVEREVLTDFPVTFDLTKLRTRINPFSSETRIASFLALMSKVIQSFRR